MRIAGLNLGSRRWRRGASPASAPSTDSQVTGHIPAAYELACGLIGVGADAQELVEKAIVALGSSPPGMGERADSGRRLLEQVVAVCSRELRSSGQGGKSSEEARRLLQVALDRSTQNRPLSASDEDLAADILSGVRWRRASRRRRLRGRAAMAASSAALAVVLASSIISSSGASAQRPRENASPDPGQKIAATIRIQSIPAPTATGPCEGAGGTFPYGSPTCVMAGAVPGVAYPILWYDHCGVLPWTQFDGKRFYVAAVDPTTVDQGLGGGFPNFIPGTMTLTSPHDAVFRDSATGRTVDFVDTLPGQVGAPYPYRLQLYEAWNHVEISFAGRLWTSEVVPPTMIPGGSDRSTSGLGHAISGVLTLTTDVQAEFVDPAGTRLGFTIDNPMCA